MKTEQIQASLGNVDLSTLNPSRLALDSIQTENAHLKEFLENFKSEFFSSHIIRIQHSVKVTRDTLIRDRVVVLVYKKRNFTQLNDILKIARKYKFPERHVARLSSEFDLCTCVMFAIEADGDKVKYKIYCEPPMRKFGFGFKWTPSSCVVSRYELYPVDDYKTLIDSSGFGLHPEFLSKCEITKAMILRDENTTKRGFELEFKNLFFKDISRDVFNLTAVDLRDKLKDLAYYPVVHFSGGIDSTGDKYFNLYFMIK